MRGRTRALVLLAAALVAVATACSAGSSNSSSAPEVRKAAPDQAKRPGTSANRTAPVVPEARDVVHTADLTVRVKDVARAGDRAKADVTDAGGYVGDETTTDGRTGHDTSTLELRVPVDKYAGTLDRLRRDVGRPVTQHQSSQDRTAEVADVKSRISSAQTSLGRLRKIMDRATTVSDVMEVEGQISTRESDLESLQAQARALDRQTSYSTITLNLVGPLAVVHTKADEPGFLDGLAAGWHALVAFLRVAVMVIGAVLPFAALVAVFAVPGWWFWRRRRRTGEDPAPAE